LLEKQSTNYVTNSENFSAWLLTNTIVTSNQVISPDGTQNADKLDCGSAFGQHRYYQLAKSGLTNETLSFTIHLKYGNHRYISFGINDYSDYRGQVVVDLLNGVITDQYTSGATMTNVSLVSLSNGWYRLSGTIQTSWSFGEAYAFGLMGEYPGFSTAGFTGTNTYAYVWGAQLEVSSYATSYIPTTSTSVTRLSDSCYKAGISSLIGQTEGTIFVDFVYNGSANTGQYNRIVNITDGTTNNFISIAKNNTTAEIYIYSETSALLH